MSQKQTIQQPQTKTNQHTSIKRLRGPETLESDMVKKAHETYPPQIPTSTTQWSTQYGSHRSAPQHQYTAVVEHWLIMYIIRL